MLPAPTAFDYTALPATTATALRKQAAKIKERVRATTAGIIEIGRDLIAVKQTLEHGQFSQWVEAECGFTARSAQNYMRAAEFAEGKYETVAVLPPAVVYKLSAKKAPIEVVKQVIQRAAAGVAIVDRDVDAALIGARREKRAAQEEARKRLRRSIGQQYRSGSKKALAIETARQTQELEDRRRQEKNRAAALLIIGTLGEEHARFLLGTFSADRAAVWQILEDMKAELDPDSPEARYRKMIESLAENPILMGRV